MIYTPLFEKIFPWITFRINSQNQKNLYLTFDDGPDPNSTLEICNILEKFNAKASFFVVGKLAEKHPDIVKQVDKGGHLICNHSYWHKKYYSKKAMFEEVHKTQEIIKSITQKPGHYYRPPHGRIYPGLRKSTDSMNLKVVLWDVFVPDYNMSFDANKIIKRILSTMNNGSIILLHDCSNNVKETIKALPNLISKLKDQDYCFKSLCAIKTAQNQSDIF